MLKFPIIYYKINYIIKYKVYNYIIRSGHFRSGLKKIWGAKTLWDILYRILQKFFSENFLVFWGKKLLDIKIQDFAKIFFGEFFGFCSGISFNAHIIYYMFLHIKSVYCHILYVF